MMFLWKPLYKLWSCEVSVVGVARWSSFTAVCQFVCFPFTGQSSSLVVPSSSSTGLSHLQSQPRTHPVHAVAWCQGVPHSIPQSGHGLLIPSSPWYQRNLATNDWFTASRKYHLWNYWWILAYSTLEGWLQLSIQSSRNSSMSVYLVQ